MLCSLFTQFTLLEFTTGKNIFCKGNEAQIDKKIRTIYENQAARKESKNILITLWQIFETEMLKLKYIHNILQYQV